MQVTGLFHVAIKTNDLDATVKFYTEVLGMKLVHRPDFGFPGAWIAAGDSVPMDVLALDSQITDCNAAIFDVANDFHGVICGCHEILRRQGLLEGIWCLDPGESLGPGQKEEIDRVCAAYPHLADDAFVRANVARWLA